LVDLGGFLAEGVSRIPFENNETPGREPPVIRYPRGRRKNGIKRLGMRGGATDAGLVGGPAQGQEFARRFAFA
ncbi:MAG: hypothetical protein MK186_11250, partial [Henriciella sp.]|nr:hypothetical protein [Henriciella sp.]